MGTKQKKQVTIKEDDISAVVEMRNPEERIQSVWNRGRFYEANLLSYVRGRLRLIEKRRKPIIVDVGSSIGNHTLYWLKCGYKVIAVEPKRAAIDHFNRNMELNNLAVSDNCVNFELALSDRNEWLRMRNIRVVEKGVDPPTHAEEENRTYRVKAIRLDDIFANVYSYGFCTGIDVMKIDVEGFNLPVLRGGEETIRDHMPDIYIECKDPTAKDNAATYRKFAEVKGLLQSWEYRYSGCVFNASYSPMYLFVAA